MKLEDKQKRFGNWFIPVLIGCFSLILIYWAYSEAPTHRHYNPSSAHSADNTYEQSSSISKLPPNVDAKTKTTKKHSKKDEESFVAERSDLAAQWAMAHYTFVGLIIGMIGIGFIIWTIIETRGAAHFAEQALNETKENSKRELRAYVTLSNISGGQIPTTTSVNNIVDFNFQNDGATPASNIKIQHRWVRLNSENDGVDSFRNSKLITEFENSDFNKSTLGSDKIVTVSIRQTHEIKLIRLIAGHYIGVVEMKIFFTNIYGERWCNHYFFSVERRNLLEEKEAYQYQIGKSS